MSKYRKPLKFKIDDETWTIRYSKRILSSGVCDYERRTITIHPTRHDEQGTMDTEVHELMHVAFPHHREDVISRGAKIVAQMLWELGYRRQKPEAG